MINIHNMYLNYNRIYAIIATDFIAEAEKSKGIVG